MKWFDRIVGFINLVAGIVCLILAMHSVITDGDRTFNWFFSSFWGFLTVFLCRTYIRRHEKEEEEERQFEQRMKEFDEQLTKRFKDLYNE